MVFYAPPGGEMLLALITAAFSVLKECPPGLEYYFAQDVTFNLTGGQMHGLLTVASVSAVSRYLTGCLIFDCVVTRRRLCT
jgi:hypothetical protein